MVSNGNLLIAPTVTVPESRVHALLQHEVGTHIVTHVNGSHQPLRLLGAGLADNDETQEGLAVFAEYLAGGLTARRLRQLAARVIAVHQMTDGESFADVHKQLVANGVGRVEAFTITMRVFRSGGLTKDAVYLRGLRNVVTHVGAGGALDALWLGKMALSDVPHIEDLRGRGALHEPLLTPRYLADVDAQTRLASITTSTTPVDLIGVSSMRIGFVVNDVQTEKAEYTTTRLAMSATRMGHEAWMMGVGDFAHRADGSVGARARSTTGKKFKSLETYLGNLQGDEAEEAQISVDELDVLMLRNDPAEDVIDRPWAVTSGILFAQLSVANGVLVVNDPASLANAVNKTYFQHFPEVVRPLTLISRDPTEIVEFVHQVGDAAVLKPLQGSGGSSVFRVSSDESPNLNQMIEAITRDGYVVAQEFLTEAEQGDVRLFVMNGQPLRQGDAYAAFRRVSTGTDFRSNMHVGGKPKPVHVTDDMLSLIEAVRPKLIEDGMFLVGLDIVGAKLMEINVFSPGGLGTCQTLYKVDFAEADHRGAGTQSRPPPALPGQPRQHPPGNPLNRCPSYAPNSQPARGSAVLPATTTTLPTLWPPSTRRWASTISRERQDRIDHRLQRSLLGQRHEGSVAVGGRRRSRSSLALITAFCRDAAIICQRPPMTIRKRPPGFSEPLTRA